MEKLQFENKVSVQKWVHQLTEKFQKRQLVLLSGQMGAGKTQLTHFILEGLESSEIPSSPSFALHQQYSCPHTVIHHFDLYRLEDEEDLESCGFWDFFEEDHGVILIEWADRLDLSFLPHNWNQILINIEVPDTEKEQRIIEFSQR